MSSLYRKAKDKLSPLSSLRRKNSKKKSDSGDSTGDEDDISSTNSIRSSLSRTLSRRGKKAKKTSLDVERSRPLAESAPVKPVVDSAPVTVEAIPTHHNLELLPEAAQPELVDKPVNKADYEPILSSEHSINSGAPPVSKENEIAAPEEEQQNYGSTNEEPSSTIEETSAENKPLSPNSSKNFEVSHFNPLSTTAGDEFTAAGTLIPAVEEELQPLLSRSRASILSEEATVPAEASWSVLVFLTKIFEFCYHKNPKSSAVVLILLILIFILFYTAFKQIDVLLLQSVQPDLQSISVLDVNDEGVNLHIIASIFVNYDSISNIAYKYLVKSAALFVGAVTFVPSDSIKIFVSHPSAPNSFDHLIDIFPPELSINTIDKSLTEIDFISKADFVEDNIIKVINSIKELSKTQDRINLQILSTIEGNVNSHFFNYDTHGMDFNFDYDLEPEKLKPTIDVGDFTLKNSNSGVGYNLSTSFELKLELPLKFELNPIEWEVILKDCNYELVSVGEDWLTGKIVSEPNTPLAIEVSGTIEEIPDSLTHECTGPEKSSIINQLIQRLLLEESIFIAIKAKKSKNNEENLPHWLYSIFSNIESEIDITLPSLNPDYFLNEYPCTVNLEDLSIDVPSFCDGLPCTSNNAKKSFTSVEGNSTFVVEIPRHSFNVDLGKSKFKGDLIIKNNLGNELIEITSSNIYSELTVNQILQKKKEIVEIDFEFKGFEINYLQPTEIGHILNSTINEVEGLLSSLLLDLIVHEFTLNLPILKTTLKDLTFKNISLQELPKIENAFDKQKYLDDLISSVEVNVTNIYYVSSTSEELNLEVGIEVTNPTNISINIPHDTLGMDVSYNGTYIGNFTVTNLFIPKQKDDLSFSLIAGVNLKPHGLIDKLALERLVSEFVSGYSGMAFEIDGNPYSLKHNQELNDIIKQIGISSISLPPITFMPPENDEDAGAKEDGPDEEARRSPFLIASTIHILSSEIEITMYNPLSNAELMVQIDQAQATYKGELLGQLAHLEMLMIPPGLYTTPRIPVKISSGLGMDILRKAINGQLDVEVIAVFGLRLDKYDLQLFYEGAGLQSSIKLWLHPYPLYIWLHPYRQTPMCPCSNKIGAAPGPAPVHPAVGARSRWSRMKSKTTTTAVCDRLGQIISFFGTPPFLK